MRSSRGHRPSGIACALLVALTMGGCGATKRGGIAQVATGGTGGTAGMSEEGGAPPGLEAVPSAMHRLNATEYEATVGDVLGSTAALTGLPVDGESYGFDNIAAALNVTEETYASYLDAAELVAKSVFADDAARARVVTCAATDDAACVQSVITGAGLRLFRRPLFEQETPIYERVYAAARQRGDLHEAALEQVLVALLASAQFLYRMEFPGDADGTQPLGPYELASRLSYFLWSSAPDDGLLEAAANEALSDDAELTAEVARLWADPRSRRFSKSFAGQWLGARRLPERLVDAATFPEWTPELAAAAAAEIYEYFDAFVYEERDWLGFLRGHAHEVDGSLSHLYGLSPMAAGERVLLPEGERAGYLGSVGFLRLTSLERRTSPSHRGRVILHDLLCQPLPPPPPDVPALDLPEQEPRTVRQYLETLWGEPSCALCHLQIDPWGLALEHYDAIGRYRTSYDNGELIDAHGTLPVTVSFPQRFEVSSLPDVVERITTDPAFQSCLVSKVYAYGLGRVPSEVDERNIAALARGWQEGPRTIKELVRQLVLAAPFRFRNDGALP